MLGLVIFILLCGSIKLSQCLCIADEAGHVNLKQTLAIHGG